MLNIILGHLHKIIKPLFVISSLLGLQHFGFMDDFLDKNTIFRLDTPKLIFIGLAVIMAGGWMVEYFVHKMWAVITPIQDRVTYIEGEIVYALSITFGATFMYVMWFGGPLAASVEVIKWTALATLPSLAIGWMIKNWQEALSPYIGTAEAEEITPKQKQGFWQGLVAYLVAATIFSACIIISLQAIFYIRAGQIIDWMILIPSCLGLTFICLVLFGHSVVSLGHRVLTAIDIEFEYEKVNQFFAYTLGCLTCSTVIIVSSLGVKYFNNPESLSAWWTYAVAYVIIVICLVLAGIGFGVSYPTSERRI